MGGPTHVALHMLNTLLPGKFFSQLFILGKLSYMTEAMDQSGQINLEDSCVDQCTYTTYRAFDTSPRTMSPLQRKNISLDA